MARPFFTIRHTTRSIDEFVNLLSEAEVRLVVDVSDRPAVTHQPAIQLGSARRSVVQIPDRLRACCCAWRPAWTEAGRAGGREHVLAESEVSQLRRLRHERGIAFGARYPVRNHVCGGSV